MNRYLVVFIALLLVVAAAVGAVLLLRPGATAPAVPQQGMPQPISSTVSVPTDRSAGAAQTAFRREIAPYVTDNVRLQETVVVGDYALQVWSSDSMGGEALLRYDSSQSRWAFITAGGGSWSIDGLASAGVPKDTAAALLSGLPR
mgnify:CR=1 FL=1